MKRSKRSGRQRRNALREQMSVAADVSGVIPILPSSDVEPGVAVKASQPSVTVEAGTAIQRVVIVAPYVHDRYSGYNGFEHVRKTRSQMRNGNNNLGEFRRLTQVYIDNALNGRENPQNHVMVVTDLISRGLDDQLNVLFPVAIKQLVEAELMEGDGRKLISEQSTIAESLLRNKKADEINRLLESIDSIDLRDFARNCKGGDSAAHAIIPYIDDILGSRGFPQAEISADGVACDSSLSPE